MFLYFIDRNQFFFLIGIPWFTCRLAKTGQPHEPMGKNRNTLLPKVRASICWIHVSFVHVFLCNLLCKLQQLLGRPWAIEPLMVPRPKSGHDPPRPVTEVSSLQNPCEGAYLKLVTAESGFLI